MDKLLLLHDLQKSVRHKASLKDLSFIFANDPFKLVPYEQCIFWLYDNGLVSLQAVSGGGQLDKKSPFSVWLKALIKNKASEIKHNPDLYDAVSVIEVLQKSSPEDLKKDWAKYVHEFGILAVFFSQDGQKIGGLWIDRKQAFNPAEIKILEELFDQYAAALHHALSLKKTSLFFGIFGKLVGYKKYIGLLLLALCFLPVRLSITAPAEIVAKDSKVLSAPYDGILDTVLINPGETVQKGDVIARMDQTSLKAEAEIAKQVLDVAKATVSQTRRLAISNAEKHSELGVLNEEIKIKKLEYDFATTLLERSEIKAPKSGVAIFSDKSSLEGVPFSTGQTLLKIANPDHFELRVRIPIESLIPFDREHAITFYLNARPLSPITANIHTVGFQATPDPDGLLTYKLRADFQNQDKGNMRIGWEGVTKIYGNWTILSYAILRRPLASLRQMIGVG